MDPGRREMLAKPKPPRQRTGMAPRLDAKTRITKTARRDTHTKTAERRKSKYLTQDEQSRQFVADEDKFVLKQSRKKADIRVREGRAKPIDRLAFNLRYIDPERDVIDDDDGDLELELQTPVAVVEELGTDQLDELQSDIGSFLVLEGDATIRQYWEAIKILCAERKSRLGPLGHEHRVLSSVAEDIDKILRPKTHSQLETLEEQIKEKLRSTDDIDTDYWEQLLQSLSVWKSKATLTAIFDSISEEKNKLLLERNKKTEENRLRNASSDNRPAFLAFNVAEARPEGVQAPINEDVSLETKVLYDREAARGISENEEMFTAEEAVPGNAKPRWTGKYRARKPRYFNRVQMGYEWNKYNQTHYDHDNPPPKVVQGYKFNIFYPELIDKTKAPTFKIIREHGRRRGQSHAAAGEADTCLIHFISGPPYEDIAFRIVDREWDLSAKRERGYRSTFDKGILQLHFQFKKVFYRK